MADSTHDWLRFLPTADSNGVRSVFGAAYAGEIVCVAGAAGYIGSALVKALAVEGARSLILLDSSEHGLFEMQRYMQSAYPGVPCEYVLGDVGNRVLVDDVFGRIQPQIIFHAAAFKHVGLLEHNPFAAIQNNAVGTHCLVGAAVRHGVAKFVLLSTDKAVKPHSVMGVSKRIAELLTLSQSSPKFRASAIRLGNVIGSRGSVVPLLLEQIGRDQPLSVTHPQVERYFLSLEASVRAILAAGEAACDGMVLIPELGAPVLIADLARFVSRAHGDSHKICFTGLKPGEKLSEDLLSAEEAEVGRLDGSLRVVRTRRLSPAGCEEAAARLGALIAQRDHDGLLRLLRELAPEYVPSGLMQNLR